MKDVSFVTNRIDLETTKTDWLSPISVLPEIGKQREKRLNKMGIFTIKDFLLYAPRRYEDRKNVKTIKDALPGYKYTFFVRVVEVKRTYTRKGVSQTRVLFADPSGCVEGIFWGQGYLADTVFKPGLLFFIYGSVEKINKKWIINNPEYELYVEEDDFIHVNRIVPIYTVAEGLSKRSFRRWIYTTLVCTLIQDPLPAKFIRKHNLLPLNEAINKLHFPERIEDVEQARIRLAYDEVFAIQSDWLQWRKQIIESQSACSHQINGPLLSRFRDRLPFQLTQAQQRVINEILHDMQSRKPMMRLVQGDVGCGKTLVAVHALLSAVDGGYQSVLMAPTEVLAEQHYMNMQKLLHGLPVRLELLTGSVRNAQEIRERLAHGEINLVVGTQALIQEKTQFRNLGLVIIDEQHRFGVMQRKKLYMKGRMPDVLHLTATPIPRSLALTVYGGMDISVIDELPPGRQPIKTYIVREHKREELIRFVMKQADQKLATYWVCASIEESDYKENLKSLLAIYEKLSTGPFVGYKTAILHGRLAFNEKAEILERFACGEIDILFCTTVIEVGVDVPHATVMVIENAECFGLAQLHQLRGRVGRGSYPSYCFLLTSSRAPLSMERLKVLCSTQNGFEIAEKDLLLRGHGEIGGLRQAGETDLRFVDFSKDLKVIQNAREDAWELVMNSKERE